MSFLADLVFWLGLAVTGGSVFYLHVRLRRLNGDLAAYRAALAETTDALATAERALARLVGEGREVTLTLAAVIEQGSRLAGRAQSFVPEAARQAAARRANDSDLYFRERA